METVITRIMEIEKSSAMEIKQAEQTSKKNVEALELGLEGLRQQLEERILTEENARLTKALQELDRKLEEASLAAGREYESLFLDPAKTAAVKEKIAAILLAE
jgi:hypothetical protein